MFYFFPTRVVVPIVVLRRFIKKGMEIDSTYAIRIVLQINYSRTPLMYPDFLFWDPIHVHRCQRSIMRHSISKKPVKRHRQCTIIPMFVNDLLFICLGCPLAGPLIFKHTHVSVRFVKKPCISNFFFPLSIACTHLYRLTITCSLLPFHIYGAVVDE